MTSAQRKKAIMDELDKKVQEKRSEVKRATPKAAGSAKKQTTKSGAKDWSKIHQKAFDKMTSIDDYLTKKRKRTDELTGSVKKVKAMAADLKSVVSGLKKPKTPLSADRRGGAKVVKPVTGGKKSTPKPFVPSVTSTAKMDLNFSAMKSPRASAKKTPAKSTPARAKTPASKAKTPAKSARTPAKPASVRKAPGSSAKENAGKKSLTASATKARVTPLKAGTSNAPTSASKASRFDLKASLSKPVPWKMYTGKLEPITPRKAAAHGMTTSKPAKVTHKKNVKSHKLASKADKRKAKMEQRGNKRMAMKMNKRGFKA